MHACSTLHHAGPYSLADCRPTRTRPISTHVYGRGEAGLSLVSWPAGCWQSRPPEYWKRRIHTRTRYRLRCTYLQPSMHAAVLTARVSPTFLAREAARKSEVRPEYVDHHSSDSKESLQPTGRAAEIGVQLRRRVTVPFTSRMIHLALAPRYTRPGARKVPTDVAAKPRCERHHIYFRTRIFRSVSGRS